MCATTLAPTKENKNINIAGTGHEYDVYVHTTNTK